MMRRGRWMAGLGVAVLAWQCGGEGDGPVEENQVAEEEQEFEACLELEATFTELDALRAIDFGVLEVAGAERAREFELRNCLMATKGVQIEGVEIVGEGFVLTDAPQPRALMAGERMKYEVVFRPEDAGAFEGTLTIETGEGDLEVQLLGERWDCPTFGVEARALTTQEAWGRTVMLTNQATRAEVRVVEVEGEEGALEEIASWEWTADGGTTVVPVDGGRRVHVTPSQPGYTSLQVRGMTAEGWECVPSPNWEVGIHNAVGTDVMVLLEWDPRGEIAWEEVVNVDLHYRNRNGAWRDPEWDVFSRQTERDWGAGGQVKMSHYVLRIGRWESTYHQGPRTGDAIEIGAHIIRGLEFEPERVVEVEAKVAIRGSVVATVQSGLDALNRGWHVGTIRWPDQVLDVADELYPVLWDAP